MTKLADDYAAMMALHDSEDITVSPEWANESTGFAQFSADLGTPPSPDHRLVFFGCVQGPYQRTACNVWGKETVAYAKDSLGLDSSKTYSPKRIRKILRNGGIDPRRSIRPTINGEGELEGV